jgi:hypothetical protein
MIELVELGTKEYHVVPRKLETTNEFCGISAVTSVNKPVN